MKFRLLSVMFLVAGTCIGGGMLALPVATANAGFLPSLLMMAICGLFMAVTGLYFIEAALWMEPGAHFVTMSKKLLGSYGQFVVVILYLFIGYASLVAYAAGGGDLLAGAFSGVDRWLGCLIFTAIFGAIIWCGHKVVGPVNSVLFGGLVVAYVLLVISGASEVTPSMLLRSEWSDGIFALPLILTIFSYQAIVPSLVDYLDRDGRRLTWAICGGVAIAFVIYAIWQALIFGVVPLEGPFGLREALAGGVSATGPFRHFVHTPWLATIAEFFAFFALVTSFLGIGMGLRDFLGDGLKLNPLSLTLLVTLPSLAFAILYPQAFLVALEASGGFGDSILNGVIPVLMIVSGRYVHRTAKGYRVAGGIPLLLVILLIAFVVLGTEIFERVTIGPSANPQVYLEISNPNAF